MEPERIQTGKTLRLSGKRLVLLFAVGLVSCLFSNGRFNISILGWVWPVCLLAVFRGAKGNCLWGAAIGFWLLQALRLWGFSGGGGLMDILSGLLVGLVPLAAFLLDRLAYGWLKERVKGAAVLFFPCVFTGLNVLADLLVSVNRLGYTQADNLPLMQAAAVVGSHGLTFLLACFASVLLYALEQRGEGKRGMLPLCLYGALMLAVMIAGGARLTFFQSTGDYTMTVASVLSPAEGDFMDGSLESVSEQESLRYLEEMSRQAAAGKADLLCTAEEAFEVDDTELPGFLAAASAMAKEQGLWMLLGFDVRDTDGSDGGRGINQVCLIDSAGAMAGEYCKTCLVPIEKLDYVTGDGEILYAEIPLKNGKTVGVSTVICFDGNNSAYVSGMDHRTDVLVIPAWCWDGCDLYQAGVQRFRAVENGVSLVSSTIAAKSLVVDCQGNVMSCTDEDSRGRTSLCFAYVPVREGADRTVYHYLAPYFDWVYLLGAAVLLGAAARRGKNAFRLGAAK